MGRYQHPVWQCVAYHSSFNKRRTLFLNLHIHFLTHCSSWPFRLTMWPKCYATRLKIKSLGRGEGAETRTKIKVQYIPYNTTRCTNFSIFFLFWYVPSWSCSQGVSKPVRHIPLLCVQWKTPDDGQRNCPKHVEFYFQNKFEKLVHLVGFIIRNLSRCTVTWTSKIQ